MPPANQFGSSGISDLHAVHYNAFMAVEFKHGKNKPTVLQKAFLNTIRAAGHFAFVVNDETLVIFEAFLKAFQSAATAVQKAERRRESHRSDRWRDDAQRDQRFVEGLS